MKVLIDHPSPFLLMHGGFQIQIEQTKTALEKIGVNVDYLRWWDAAQKPDIIHFFGKPNIGYVNFAREKGIKVVLSQLLTGLGSRGAKARAVQKLVTSGIENFAPRMISAAFDWEAYRAVDISISLTAWEAQLMREMFKVPQEKIRIVPNGVEQVFLESSPAKRGPWLVCTATVTERKRILELTEAAVQAQTPVWIIGKPYADTAPYAQQFISVVKKNPKLVRYEGAIEDRARIAQAYREARGFVLLSTMESLSLSALEAAACECPLLLSDLPWARTVFKESVTYCPITDTARTAAELRRFYDAAPNLKPPEKPMSWVEVAKELRAVYESLLKRSAP